MQESRSVSKERRYESCSDPSFKDGGKFKGALYRNYRRATLRGGHPSAGGETYPAAELVYVSPMKRCRETASLIYPTLTQREEPLLRECDFGDFENKNYLELNGNPDYQAWVDSGGTLPFPGGESREAFQERCREGF